MADAGFILGKSRVNADALARFITSPIVEDITSVPGIGPAAAAKLAAGEGVDCVRTTHQLMGRFLTLRTPGITVQEHCDAMWHWLQSKGVNSFRAGIVHALAEKCNTMIPGTFDPTEVRQHEDDDL